MQPDSTSNYKSSLLRDLTETFGTNLLLIAFGTLTSIGIARILGPQMRGEFALILLWSGLFSTLVSFGINDGLGYFAGAEKGQRWKYLCTASTITAVLGMSFLVPAVLLVPHLMKTCSREAIYLGMFSIGFSVFFVPQFMAAQSFLQGSGLIRYLNLINLSNGLLYLFLVLAIWIFFPRGPHDLVLTTAAYICTFLILCFISAIFLVRVKKREPEASREKYLSIRPRETKNLFTYGGPVTLANLVNQASAKLDQIFLSFLVAPHLIGFYAVALSTAVGVTGSALTVSTIALPRITNAGGEKEKGSVIRKLFLSYFYSAIPIFLLTLIAVPYLIPALFGDEFTGAIDVSKIILAGMIFAGANQLGVAVLKALGLPRCTMMCRILTLALLAISLTILIPGYGVIGAAWAIIFSNVITGVLIMLLIGRTVKIKVADMVIPKKEDLKIAQGRALRLFSCLSGRKSIPVSEPVHKD
jgi:O-antigen/teichoic acid export membrane protein